MESAYYVTLEPTWDQTMNRGGGEMFRVMCSKIAWGTEGENAPEGPKMLVVNKYILHVG